jgi:hypothetical protein
MTPDQRLQEGTHMTGHGISTAEERTAAVGQPRQRKGERVQKRNPDVTEIVDIALAFVQKHAQP